ncbi:MAG: response regulator [Sneathiella sp.]|nr:response regulator [Sneathiella sp.]
MHLDTPKTKKGTGYKLPVLLAGGLFGVLSLLVLAILVVTFFSSSLVVENEREQISGKTGTIVDLVLEKRLDAAKQFADLISEEIAGKDAGQLEDIYSFIETAFYTQKEGNVDYIALLTEQGDIVEEIHIQLYQFPAIRKQITQQLAQPKDWYWAVEPGHDGGDPQVILYYRTEILNRFTGKVDGFIVSGLFVNENISLLEEISTRTEAEYVALRWDGEIIGQIGEANELIDYTLSAKELETLYPDELVFMPKIQQAAFPNSNLTATVHYRDENYRSLRELYVVSGTLGFGIILILSLFSYSLGNSLFVTPLTRLISYAKRLDKRDKNIVVPEFSAREFNELARTLKSVFTNFIESEQRFQDFANVTSDSVWETDPEHRYTFVSRDKSTPNPLRYGGLIGKRRWEVEGIDENYGDWEGHKALLAKHEPFRGFIFRRVNPLGNVEYWSASGRPRFDQNGKYLGYRGTSSNITAEQLAQQEAEKVQEQLRQSQKLEVVGQLTGGIAHDFNNLLAVVLGNLELALEDEKLDPTTRKMLGDAVRGAERGASLTHQLLAYSRQQTLQPSVIQPQKIVTEMFSLFKRAVGESVSLKTYLESNWSITVDPNELENALMNLLINSRDAMPLGGEISIESFNMVVENDGVESEHELETGEYVCICVTDTGSGMNKETQSRIFEPFFTTKEVGKGSGLGLSMVFGFAKQSGGSVGIYSEEGVGTSIKLYLPRALSDDEEEGVSPVHSSIKFGGGETVVVIEDDPKVAEMIARQLQAIGYTPEVYLDSSAGILALEEDKADALLVDVIMPGNMNGFDIAEHVKNVHPDLPLVLMSGFTGNNLPLKQKRGITENSEILMKPFTKQHLSEALYNAIAVKKIKEVS